ncbi:hypothetical protein [Deinococcus ruber]|uniref:Uncharacterized protein n=1 Tax=Deinococcus ruber TaxID=1848197 RepID=A0A918C8P8_9DEIO|nr:hypothetical protein [Deinococcus ruber]GGR11384.1 hypothetical protein GCM10008957_25170 [Deinococcus ruber]
MNTVKDRIDLEVKNIKRILSLDERAYFDIISYYINGDIVHIVYVSNKLVGFKSIDERAFSYRAHAVDLDEKLNLLDVSLYNLFKTISIAIIEETAIFCLTTSKSSFSSEIYLCKALPFEFPDEYYMIDSILESLDEISCIFERELSIDKVKMTLKKHLPIIGGGLYIGLSNESSNVSLFEIEVV